jgi:hypothetical protein
MPVDENLPFTISASARGVLPAKTNERRTVSGSIDTDAQAFLTAAAISDSTIISAVDTLVKAYKSASIWNKMHALYPFVGGSATAHSFNLRNPAQFQMVWEGTVTHNSLGITGDGLTGSGLTNYNPSVSGVLNDNHISIYNRTNTPSDSVDIGCETTGSEWVIVARGGDGKTYTALLGGNASYPAVTLPTQTGSFIVTKPTPSTTALWYNGVEQLAGAAALQNSLINNSLRVLATTNTNVLTAKRWASANLAMVSIGLQLTPTDVAAKVAADQAFQTTLGRQV